MRPSHTFHFARLFPPFRGRGLVLVLCFLLLIGCSRFSDDTPPVPDSTFTRVLMEMHLMEARSTLEPPLPPGLRDSILARYDLQPEEYEATLEHYSRNPQAFETLYQKVIDSLRSTRNTMREGPGTIPDSLPNQGNRDSP